MWRNYKEISWIRNSWSVRKSGMSEFYGEHFHGFLESDLWKRWKKSIHFIYISNISINISSQTFWSFMKFYFVHVVKVCFVFKNSFYAYIPPYTNKTLPKLGNEKEQQQIKFYKTLLGELIFPWVTKNLKMFYFTRPTGRVLKK